MEGQQSKTQTPAALAPCGGSAAVECEEAVIEKIRLRRDTGRRKYGMTMERKDLPVFQWLHHAQEEAMDLAIYLERLLREEARKGAQLSGKSYRSVEALMRDSNLPPAVWKEYRRLKKEGAGQHEAFGKWHVAHAKDRRLNRNKPPND